LYNFIQDTQGYFTLSGQHNFVGKGSDYSEQLEEITGKKAIIWGSDFSFCVEGVCRLNCRLSEGAPGCQYPGALEALPRNERSLVLEYKCSQVYPRG